MAQVRQNKLVQSQDQIKLVIMAAVFVIIILMTIIGVLAVKLNTLTANTSNFNQAPIVQVDKAAAMTYCTAKTQATTKDENELSMGISWCMEHDEYALKLLSGK